MRAAAIRTQPIWFFLLFMGLGYALPGIFDIQGVKESPYYPLVLNILLGVGLYASVRGIDHADFREGKRTVLLVVTLGVAMKIAIIGSIVYILSRNPLSFVFAVVVAQIDPLSISALTLKGNYQLSTKARSYLLAWASFDDPITVIAAVAIAQYVFSVDLSAFSSGWYWQLGNIILPAAVFGIYYFTCEGKNRHWLEICLLLGGSALSVMFGWMLSIALMGLFLRPSFSNLENYIVSIAYMLALMLLGSYLAQGINVWLGAIVAVAAIAAQIVASFVFMAGLPRLDRFYLACAQQNGITAVILSLLFVRAANEIVPVIVVALVLINLAHIVLFLLLDTYVAPGHSAAGEQNDGGSGPTPILKNSTAN